MLVGRSIDSVTAELSAIRLTDGASFPIEVDLSTRASFGLVLQAFPSVPADLGADGS